MGGSSSKGRCDNMQEVCGKAAKDCQEYDSKDVDVWGYVQCGCAYKYYPDIRKDVMDKECGWDYCKVYDNPCKNGGKCVTTVLGQDTYVRDMIWRGTEVHGSKGLNPMKGAQRGYKCECKDGWAGDLCNATPGEQIGKDISNWFGNLGTWEIVGLIGAGIFIVFLFLYCCAKWKKKKQMVKARRVEQNMLEEEMMYRQLPELQGEYPQIEGYPHAGDYPQSMHSYTSSRHPQESRYPESRYPEKHEVIPLNRMPHDYPESVGSSQFPVEKPEIYSHGDNPYSKHSYQESEIHPVDSRGDSVSHYGTHRSARPKHIASRRSSNQHASSRRSSNQHASSRSSRHDNRLPSHGSSAHHDDQQSVVSRGSSRAYDDLPQYKSIVRSIYRGSEAGRSSRRTSRRGNPQRRNPARKSGRIDKRKKMARHGSNTSLDTINQFLREKENDGYV